MVDMPPNQTIVMFQLVYSLTITQYVLKLVIIKNFVNCNL